MWDNPFCDVGWCLPSRGSTRSKKKEIQEMRNVKAKMATHEMEQDISLQQGGTSRRLSRRLTDPAQSTWASLHTDLLDLIASRVLASDLLDYVRFRAVCLGWRVMTPCPRGRGVVDPCFHPRQWMMFPEGDGLYPGHPALLGYVRFFNLSTGTFVRVRLPCFRNHSVLDCPDGLLLLRDNKSTAIRLLHPFTGDVVLFSPLSSIFPQLAKLGCFISDSDNIQYTRFVRGSVSVNLAGTVTMMLGLGRLDRVAYASTGDRQWTPTSWKMKHLYSALPLGGSLYVVDGGWGLEPSRVLRIDPPEDSNPSSWSVIPPQMVTQCPVELLRSPELVECNSELLLVGYDSEHSKIVLFRVADLLNGVTTIQLTSIGDQALFIGACNMAVNSKFLPSVQGNSIAIVNEIGGGVMGRGTLPLYDLGNSTWSQVFDGNFVDSPMPRPYSLVLHVTTCCHRLFWNSGDILCFKQG
ncbi:hypothetical protein VPH35_136750 [Triticum aestivum]|uniref:KIB1-4 beta-propeller domain-containing protein n=3 Tax=Triticum aestivum TaxID=4565 RepID=A0A3B6TPV5_WHEAT|nr:uncharacterized protein LOC123167278 isoform X1 [Triticum aestivum]XP_044441045.1 uncharacterized protein LOC123167278 isoform X1 [Triticum aestivum]